MFLNLLSSSASTSSGSSSSNWTSWAMIIFLVLIIVVFMVLNNRSAKKRQKEQQDMLNAIQPGNKVKTIGGICGIVVEVNPEDNTFVLETGTEASGKSYLKFDKQAVYQTDATAKKTEKVEKVDEGETQQTETTETTETNAQAEDVSVNANDEKIEETETKE